MKVTTKGRYALRIMVDLAQQQTESFIPIKEVSERQCISEKYAEMIVGLLNKAGMLHSARGKGGGPDAWRRHWTALAERVAAKQRSRAARQAWKLAHYGRT